MNNITIISGGPNSGKTCQSKKIIGDNEFIKIQENELKNRFCFSELTINTKYIVIDDIQNLKNVVNHFRGYDKVIVEKKYKNPIQIDIPNIILITERLRF